MNFAIFVTRSEEKTKERNSTAFGREIKKILFKMSRRQFKLPLNLIPEAKSKNPFLCSPKRDDEYREFLMQDC